MRITRLLMFSMLIIFKFALNAQVKTEYELDSLDLLTFKEEAKHKYLTFFESTLNIIDLRLDISERYRSRSNMINLVENTNTKVEDIVRSPNPIFYTIINYSAELLDASKNMPLFYKKFKYDTAFEFKSGVTARLDGNRGYRVYNGSMYVLEKLINSINIPGSLLNEPTFNAYEEGVLKEVKFRIGHDQNKNYELKIEGIKIILKENKSYDYEKIVERIKKSAFPYSDKSEELYIAMLKDTVKQRGWKFDTIVQPNLDLAYDEIENIDTTTVEKLKYKSPRVIDIMLPGYGHMRYGLNKNARIIKTIGYSSIFISSSIFATYNKIASNNAYRNHISSTTFRESKVEYNVANKFHRKYIIGTGIAVGSFLANGVHIYISHQKQQSRINEAMKNRKTSLSVINNKLIPDIKLGGDFTLTWTF